MKELNEKQILERNKAKLAMTQTKGWRFFAEELEDWKDQLKDNLLDDLNEVDTAKVRVLIREVEGLLSLPRLLEAIIKEAENPQTTGPSEEDEVDY